MRKVPFWTLLGLLSVVLLGCGGANTQKPPAEIPEICRFMDLKDPQMAEICGLRADRNRAYKNIPPMRFLSQPKGATLALVGGKVELRLPSTLPVVLGDSLVQAIDFSDRAKRDFVKNSYDYHEIYPQPDQRLRLFQLTIPVLGGAQVPFCFNMPDRVLDERRKDVSGHEVRRMECAELTALVQKENQKQVAAATPQISSSAVLSSSSQSTTKRRVKR
jgi:hypothetical protein